MILGGRVKDIDIFVDSSRYPTDERRDNLCDRIYEAFGQTWQRTTPSAETRESYGADPDTGEEFQTYNSLTSEGEWNRVNVIFSRNNQKIQNFDWSICRFFVEIDSPNPIWWNHRDGDLNNIRFVGRASDLRNTSGVVEHAQRIRAKYPISRFVFDTNVFQLYTGLYTDLLTGGLIGEQARQVLPTQTEIPTGDSVGLNSRARFGQGSRGSTIRETTEQWAERARRTERWRDAAQRITITPDARWIVADEVEAGEAVRVPDFDSLVNPFSVPPRTITPEQAAANRAEIERMQERARRAFEANFRNLTNGRPSF